MKKLKNLVLLLSAAALSCSAIACGGNAGGEHDHTFDTAHWAKSDTHHWHEATCGHNIKPEDSDGYATHTTDGDCVCGYTAAINAMKMDEFLANHIIKAQNFVNLSIRPNVVEDREVKAESWYMVANDDQTKLSTVNIVYTYVVNETDRQVEIASVSIGTPIKFDDIVKGYYTLKASDLDVDRTEVFNFNAKTNYNKQDFAIALFNKAGIETTDFYPNAIFSEVYSPNEFFRAFELFDQTNDRITIKRIYADKGDGTDEYAASNLHGPSTTIKATYNIDGTNIYNSAYTLENLGPEEEKPNDGDDDDDDDEPITNAEIIAALDRYCAAGIISECIPIEIDKNDISNKNWYVTKDLDDKIISAEYLFIYNRSSSTSYLTLGKVEFDSAISAQALKDGKIGNVTYSKICRIDYNPTIQDTRAELTNAICNKVFGENEGATRYIKDGGSTVNETLHQLRRFTVVQVTEKEIKTCGISISHISPEGVDNVYDDEKYIRQLSYHDKYEIGTVSTYQINGVKVENNNSPFAAN